MNLVIKILLSAIAVVVASYLLPGVVVEGFTTAIFIAVILSLLNATVKPLLIVLTIPLTIITLGLFLIVINAVIVLIADFLIADFEVYNFWWALIFSLVLSIVNALLTDLRKDLGK